MTVRLLAVAQAELDEAISWCRAQAPGLAEVFLVECMKVFRLIEQHPNAWHPLSETIRQCRLARFPYGVIYAASEPDIVVIAIAHLHRMPMYWRDRTKR